MNPISKLFTLAFFLTLLAATSLQASITGSISGVVSDSSGAVIGGATATATNTQTGVQVTLKTDSKGFYNFPTLQIGDPHCSPIERPGLYRSAGTSAGRFSIHCWRQRDPGH